MKITLYAHPLAVCAPQVFEIDSLGEWLLNHYGQQPSVTIQIFEGEPSLDTEISHDAQKILQCSAPEITILQSPGDPVSILVNIAIAFVLSLVAQMLAPSPVMPGNVNRTQQSPNNALGSRENKARLLERVEDIYGTVNAIPSLMMPTYVKYIGNLKYEYGYYCVGRGYYNLAEIRDGDTLIADIPGASASVYQPFTSPNSGDAPQQQIGAAIIDKVLTVKRAIEVDGITLKALNQVALPAGATYTFVADPVGRRVQQTQKTPNFNSVCLAGDGLTVSMSDYVVTTWYNAANQPVAEDDPSATHSTSTTNNYSGHYTVAAVSDGEVRLVGAPWPMTLTTTATITLDKGEATSWVTLPQIDRSEIWINVIAQNGLFKDNGGKSTCSVSFQIEIEQLTAALVPTGNVEVVMGTLSASVTDEQADTIEHATGWVGPARARMRRTTDHDFAFAGTVQDEIKWADLFSVSPVSKYDFGNKTTIQTVTQANSRATAVKARQLNCIASRLIPTYDGTSYSAALDTSGRLLSGTLYPSAKICDIIAAVSVDPLIGAQSLTTSVDMPQIFAVQQLLDAWNVSAGNFSYTFDSDNTSFEETITLIANAGFCIAYRQNGKIRLAFDRAQPNSTALFTHRNKKPDAETLTRKFASATEYDGVQFVYTDPDTKHSETITLPLDGSYTKLKKFEIPGIRSFTQAWLRANREYFKIIGQRVTLETVTTLDARNLLPNAVISVVDNTRFKAFDGEVVGQTGLEITLSRDVVFTAGQPHSIVLMRRDGSLQSITVTAGSAANKVVLQYAPSEALVTTYGPDGIRTIFSFAADSARGAMAYLVQELDTSDPQYVTVHAINYSAAYYAADYAAIPAKQTVIN